MNEYHKDIAEFKVNKTMGLIVKLFEGEPKISHFIEKCEELFEEGK